jgi:hypothetical protein
MTLESPGDMVICPALGARNLLVETTRPTSLKSGAWAKVVDSFDAWARNYNVKVETGRHGHGMRTGAGGGPVPRTSGCPAITRGQENIGETRIIVTTCCLQVGMAESDGS